MIDLPDSYRIGSAGRVLNKKEFFPKSLPSAARPRLRKTLRRVVLTHQITDETIPSRIDEDYKCVALLFLDIELEDIQLARFAAKHIQPLFKPLVRIRFADPRGRQALSFAHKRLNRNDPEAITVEDSYLSEADTDPAAFAACRFEQLRNRTDKRDLYLEAMLRAYLADHPKLFQNAEKLWDSKLWYHGDTILRTFRTLRELETLRDAKTKATAQAEKAALNKKIRHIIDEVQNRLLTPVS